MVQWLDASAREGPPRYHDPRFRSRFRLALREIATRPPMTLGNAATARVRLIVWCRACGHRVEPDAAEMAERYGGRHNRPREWRERLVCSKCGSRNVDMVVTGTERRSRKQAPPYLSLPADRSR
jgi:hypothetical protein